MHAKSSFLTTVYNPIIIKVEQDFTLDKARIFKWNAEQ
jgi:hypothetical protein